MKRTTRRIVLASIAGLVILAGLAALRLRSLLADDADYSQVISIATTREYQDPALLSKAWALPVASLYHRQGVDWQRNPSFCGPASVVNVLWSIGQDASQSTILDDTMYQTVFGLLPGGLTLDQEADVLRNSTHKHVDVLRDLDITAFRSQMRHSNEPVRRYVVNLNRGPLFGKGGGHFSPIGGYLEKEDLVFVLDVNEKYRPWLVKTERLLESVNTVDHATGLSRGLLLLDNR